MVELKSISTDKHSNSSSYCCSTITSPSSSSSNSSATPPSPASLLPMHPPLLLPDHLFSAPPQPLYFQFHHHQPFFSHYSYYPNIPYYSYPTYWTSNPPQQYHFYPQPPQETSVPLPTAADGGGGGGEAEKVAVAVAVAVDELPAASGRRRRGWVIPRRFTGGPRNFHGFRLRKAKKMWKPKEASPVRTSPSPLPRGCTTLMIKNIPNYISRRTLIDLLESHCRDENAIAEKQIHASSSEFDFLYLPFDFHRKKNLGYGFVNFTTAEGAARLHSSWNGLGWNGCPKIREITPARLQGKGEMREAFPGFNVPMSLGGVSPSGVLPGSQWGQSPCFENDQHWNTGWSAAKEGLTDPRVSRMINIGTPVGPLQKKSLTGPV